jgi:pimeloyl-ACP methyl ester carboxylesterase
LGTPGFNPAFNNRSNAYSLLDSARAVLAHFPHLARDKILLVGQSQGGSAIVAADGYAPVYAPELHLLGAIGTGIVYAAGRPLKPLEPVDPNANNKVDPTISYGFFGILSEKAVNPTLDETKIYTPLALPLLNQARTGCLWDLESDVTLLGLTRANTYVNGRNSGLSDEVVGDVGHKFVTLKLAAPLFIGAGTQDALAPGAIALAHDAHEAGSFVELHLYPGKDHLGTVIESLRDSIPFARKAIKGELIKPIYEVEGY